MSLQWTLVAVCMYVELALTVILLVPVISPKRWHSFFKSRFLASFVAMSGIYFKVFFGILVLCVLDALREMNKYSGETSTATHGHDTHLDVEMQTHMRLFRAQRNFYISFFSLMLAAVLNRLASLISNLATSQAQAEAALSQAKSASDAAQLLLDGGDKTAKQDTKEGEVKTERQQKIALLSAENSRLRVESEATRRQADGVKREYDRLLAEHAALQGRGDKKGD